MTGSAWPMSVREAAWRRCGGICEWCGLHPATQLHHRLYRSRGGPDILVNAGALCGSGNMSGCHGRAHTREGEAAGWSIRTGSDPASVQVLYRDIGWAVLLPNGDIRRALDVVQTWGDV